MSSLEHTDPTFTPDTPALSATEPSLAFMRTPRRCLPSSAEANHPSDAARERRVFVLGGRKATIAGGDIWRPAEDRDVPIERGRPQRHIRRSGRMDGIGRDDLMLALLDGDELAKLGGLRDLALPNRFGVGLKDAEDFVGHVRVAAEQPRAGLVSTRVTNGCICCSRCAPASRSSPPRARRCGDAG